MSEKLTLHILGTLSRDILLLAESCFKSIHISVKCDLSLMSLGEACSIDKIPSQDNVDTDEVSSVAYSVWQSRCLFFSSASRKAAELF